MKIKKIILGVILSSLVLTSCAPLESNYNKFEQQIVGMQTDMLDDLDIVKKNLYDYNKIQYWHGNDMPENLYLVYYHSNGGSLNEEGFERVLKRYIEEADSIRLYIAKKEPNSEVRLEFMTRIKNEYTLENIWYDYVDIEYLPYKNKN